MVHFEVPNTYPTPTDEREMHQPTTEPASAVPECDERHCGYFSLFEHATDLRDPEWVVSMYNGLRFSQKKWILPQRGSSRVRSSAFQRFPLTFAPKDFNETAASEHVAGVSFVADLRHAGSGPPGIAHFAKRILRLHGLQQQALRYKLPPVNHIIFPATTSKQLLQQWPKALLKLIAPDARTIPADELLNRTWHFAHVVVSAKVAMPRS